MSITQSKLASLAPVAYTWPSNTAGRKKKAPLTLTDAQKEALNKLDTPFGLRFETQGEATATAAAFRKYLDPTAFSPEGARRLSVKWPSDRKHGWPAVVGFKVTKIQPAKGKPPVVAEVPAPAPVAAPKVTTKRAAKRAA